jgi:hypothetical protein
MRMHLALALALVACGKSKDSSDEPATAPKVIKKKPAPQAPLPPLAKDPGGATGKPTWAIGFGGFGSTAPRQIAIDADGASYVCGYFDGTVDFGAGPKLGKRTANGASDAFVAKLDPKGALVWVQTFGGAHGDSANGVAVRGDSVVVVGNFSDNIKILGWDGKSDWDHASIGSDDAYVAAFDRDGNPKWLWTLGGLGSDGLNAIASTPDGGWVIGGSFNAIVDIEQLGIKLKSKGGTDAMLAKLAAGGDVEWIKQYGGRYDDSVQHLAVDPRGNVYVQGILHDTSDWGGKPLVAAGGSDADVVLAKYDLNGDHLWSQRFGNQFNDVPGGIAVDPSGHVTMTGSFEQKGPISFGAGDSHDSNGEADIFIARFTTDGKFEWARTFGAVREDVGFGIAADAAGNTVTTGWFQRTVDFGKGTVTSAGEKDAFALKLDATGAFVWLSTWGDKDVDKAYAVALDPSGGALVAGVFRFKLALGDLPPIESKRDEKDPALSRAPKPNAFVVRLDR